MNCKNCRYYVRRELTPVEIQYLRWNPDKLIDTRMCGLGGCNGDRFDAGTYQEDEKGQK